jgi:hypothetical protein
VCSNEQKGFLDNQKNLAEDKWNFEEFFQWGKWNLKNLVEITDNGLQNMGFDIQYGISVFHQGSLIWVVGFEQSSQQLLYYMKSINAPSWGIW